MLCQCCAFFNVSLSAPLWLQMLLVHMSLSASQRLQMLLVDMSLSASQRLQMLQLRLFDLSGAVCFTEHGQEAVVLGL